MTHNLVLLTTYYCSQLSITQNLALLTIYHYSQIITAQNLVLLTTYYYSQSQLIINSQSKPIITNNLVLQPKYNCQ